MAAPLKIGYVTTFASNSDASPTQLPGMRGGAFHLARELSAQDVRLNFLGPLATVVPNSAKIRLRLERLLFQRTWFAWLDRRVLQSYARQVQAKLADESPELIFTPQNFWPIAELETPKPVVLWTDAPFGALLEMDGYFGKVAPATVRRVHELEQRAFEKCAALVFPSRWAATKTQNLYGIAADKISVIPFGGNLPSLPTEEETAEAIRKRMTSVTCELLYVAMGWQRKGLMAAIESTRTLNNEGIPARLTVVGDYPPALSPCESLRLLGPLDRTSNVGWRRMTDLFLGSHFFVLPTLADISPFVLCEAAAFALPCLATSVGGIPQIVEDGRNGYTLSPAPRTAQDLTARVRELWRDRVGYEALCRSAGNDYHKRLNWKTSAQKLTELFHKVRGR